MSELTRSHDLFTGQALMDLNILVPADHSNSWGGRLGHIQNHTTARLVATFKDSTGKCYSNSHQ